jgi:hypothetical protein
VSSLPARGLRVEEVRGVRVLVRLGAELRRGCRPKSGELCVEKKSVFRRKPEIRRKTTHSSIVSALHQGTDGGLDDLPRDGTVSLLVLTGLTCGGKRKSAQKEGDGGKQRTGSDTARVSGEDEDVGTHEVALKESLRLELNRQLGASVQLKLTDVLAEFVHCPELVAAVRLRRSAEGSSSELTAHHDNANVGVDFARSFLKNGKEVGEEKNVGEVVDRKVVAMGRRVSIWH